MFKHLSPEDRLRLLRFACSFAWADLDIRPAERELAHRLVRSLALDEQEAELVESWLAHPPRPEDVDPQDVPMEHRELFVLAARAMVATDGEISGPEAETLALFETMMA